MPEIERVDLNRSKTCSGDFLIPENLSAALDELERMLPIVYIEELKAMPEEKLCLEQHTFGRWLRNNWELWHGSVLAQWFERELLIEHADDMSGILIDSFHRRLNGKPLALKEQAKHYQDYWEGKEWQQQSAQFTAEITESEVEKNFKNEIRRQMKVDRHGNMHFDIPALVRAAGWDDTEENRDRVTAMICLLTAQTFPEVSRTVETDNPQATKIALAQSGVTASIKKRKP